VCLRKCEVSISFKVPTNKTDCRFSLPCRDVAKQRRVNAMSLANEEEVLECIYKYINIYLYIYIHLSEGNDSARHEDMLLLFECGEENSF